MTAEMPNIRRANHFLVFFVAAEAAERWESPEQGPPSVHIDRNRDRIHAPIKYVFAQLIPAKI